MEKNPTYLFVVAAALVDQRDRILVQKRPAGKPMAGLWEFPGGKVEPGETPESALVRELREELSVNVDAQNVEPVTFASEAIATKHLVLLLYVCRNWIGTVESPDSLELQWLPLDAIQDLVMPPADGPLVEKLSRFLRSPS